MANPTNPDHYRERGTEPIDVINTWGLNFNLGNVIKYVVRAEHKGNQELDLRKAIFYLEFELFILGFGPDPRKKT